MLSQTESRAGGNTRKEFSNRNINGVELMVHREIPSGLSLTHVYKVKVSLTVPELIKISL